uniref:Secreted protein n=1 Tax=Anopheles quadriannulatus TaxID=34691 RepID=A0A182XT97_ANOQN
MQQHLDFFLFICSLSTVPFVHCTFLPLRGFCNRNRSTGGSCGPLLLVPGTDSSSRIVSVTVRLIPVGVSALMFLSDARSAKNSALQQLMRRFGHQIYTIFQAAASSIFTE